MKTNTKGLVFPSNMTLRDYFAGQVLAVQYKLEMDIFGEGGYPDDAEYEQVYADAAEEAYLVAEAMLKEKAKYDSQ
jgi:hypothetical protein